MTATSTLSIILSQIVLVAICIFPKVYRGVGYVSLGWLMVAFVGYDPVSIFVPPFLLMGAICGHIRIRRLGFPAMLRVLYAAFLIFTLISLLWSPVWNWVIRFLSGILFFYFLNLFLNSEEEMRTAFFAILGGTVTTSAAAVLALGGLWTPGAIFFPIFDSFRFAGLYNTTVLGIFSALLIVWLVDETLRPKLWVGNIVLKILLTVTLLVQLFATLTRSAWLGLFLALVIYFGLEFSRCNLRKKMKLTATLITVVAIGAYAVTTLESASLIRKRLTDDTAKTEDEQKRANFYFTRNVLKLAKAHPLGVGIGNTQKNVERFNGLEVGAHNNFVMVMSDMGWFAFATLLISQCYVVWQLLLKAVQREVKYGLSAQMLLSCYILLFAAGMYQDLLLYLPMWLFPGLSMVLLYPSANTRGTSELHKDPMRPTAIEPLNVNYVVE